MRTGFQKRPEPGLSGRQLTPLGQGRRAVLLKDVAAVEAVIQVEVISSSSPRKRPK